MMTTQNKLLTGLVVATLGGPASLAWGQVPYDPPTAQRAAPNVLLLMDSTRTTLINGSTCRGECHTEDTANAGEHEDSLYPYGETRLQLARRVLTGGWGWNTSQLDRSGTQSADASVRRDGVMDQYFVRWGLIYYDGLGARLALNPTLNNAVAQQAVIDFGQPNFGETLSVPPINPALNSYLPYWRTTQCCMSNSQQTLPAPARDGNDASTPVFDEAGNWQSRIGQALQFTSDYIDNTGGFTQWAPGPLGLLAYGAPPTAPISNFFRGDPSNVLASPYPAGCRRNFVVHLTDGHGGADYNGQSIGQISAGIHNMTRNDNTVLPQYLANQVFSVYFGVPYNEGYSGRTTPQNADLVSDCGFDGACNGIPDAFVGAPGGQINDLTPMYAAFSAIFQLVLSGTYLASPPAITRSGDRIVTSNFEIQDCQGALPNQCNIGRIGHLTMDEVLYTAGQPNGFVDDTVNFSAILRSNLWSNRNVFTSITAGATNCGRAGSPSCSQTASWWPVSPSFAPGSNTPASPTGAGTDAEFIRGAPGALFANGVQRSDTSNGGAGPFFNRDPYKLMDIANSQPVIVGAPSGIGEDIERWDAFLDLQLSRDMQNLVGGTTGWIQKRGGYAATGMRVSNRDQIVYIGGNDGLLHAFLAGTAAAVAGTGRTASYPITGGICPSAPGTPNPAQLNISGCLGMELWAYSPLLVQPFWNSIRSGHYFMVDGTPVVSDVLFTKNLSNPGLVCNTLHSSTCNNRWEYRTVLLQCLGGGGTGCFAMDVSNPYRPELLWERALRPPGTVRGASTSRPQIVRVRRNVGGVIIPYYVGIMGGGLGESNGTNRQGTVLAVGLEDGNWYASTGTHLGSADFAGAPTCLDTDGDSYTDTCYIATTDASVYKIRIGTLNSGNFGTSGQVTLSRFFDGRQRLLDVGQTAAVASAVRAYGRVVATFDTARDIRIYFATGNFEDVQNATERNFFFEIRDTAPEAPLVPWTVGLNNTRAGTACNAGSTPGVVALPAGEKSVFDPVISNGVVVYTTFRPNANPCLPGTGFLNGVEVNSCDNGIDSDGDGTPDSGAPGGTRQSYQGLPVAPVINERTGGITVATDVGGAQHNEGFTRRLPSPPVTKLWWRLVR